jgi:hypothetical protein
MKDKLIDKDKYASIGSLRPGYKRSKKKWRTDGDFSGGFQTSHWDGRLDANIRPKRVKLTAGTHGDTKGDE